MISKKENKSDSTPQTPSQPKFKFIKKRQDNQISGIFSILVFNESEIFVSGFACEDIHIYAYSENSFEFVCPLKGHTSSVRTLSKTNDESQMLSGSDDCFIILWDINNYQAITKIYTGHRLEIQKVLQTFDGRIISCSTDQTIKIFFPFEFKSLVTLKRDDGSCIRSIMEIKENVLISVSERGYLLYWDLKEYKEIKDYSKYGLKCFCRTALNYNKERDLIFVGGDREINIIDNKNHTFLKKIENITAYVQNIFELNNGNFLVGTSDDRHSLILYDKDFNYLEDVVYNKNIYAITQFNEDRILLGDDNGNLIEFEYK